MQISPTMNSGQIECATPTEFQINAGSISFKTRTVKFIAALLSQTAHFVHTKFISW